jgi:hypothetical protein
VRTTGGVGVGESGKNVGTTEAALLCCGSGCTAFGFCAALAALRASPGSVGGATSAQTPSTAATPTVISEPL